MATYKWEYLRNAEQWSIDEFNNVSKNLEAIYISGGILSLPEKDYLYRYYKVKHTQDFKNYQYNLETLAEFEEPIFLDALLTLRYNNNLLGELQTPSKKNRRQFTTEAYIKILKDALDKWEPFLLDMKEQDPFIVSLRKHRKAELKRISKERKLHKIGNRLCQSSQFYVRLLTYNIYILTKSLVSEEAEYPIIISTLFKLPVVLTNEVIVHILMTHYHPVPSVLRGRKSLFDERNSPYELVFHLRSLLNNTPELAPLEISKIEYEFMRRVFRIRVIEEQFSNNNYYSITTFHPLEDPEEIETFNKNCIRINRDGFTGILIFKT